MSIDGTCYQDTRLCDWLSSVWRGPVSSAVSGQAVDALAYLRPLIGSIAPDYGRDKTGSVGVRLPLASPTRTRSCPEDVYIVRDPVTSNQITGQTDRRTMALHVVPGEEAIL